MAENKFEKFIVRDAVQPFPQMGGNLNSPFVSGGPDLMKAIEGAIPNFALYYVLRAGMFMEGPHYHTNDEYLMFISSDPHDMKNLGAVVQVRVEHLHRAGSLCQDFFQGVQKVIFVKGLLHHLGLPFEPFEDVLAAGDEEHRYLRRQPLDVVVDVDAAKVGQDHVEEHRRRLAPAVPQLRQAVDAVF